MNQKQKRKKLLLLLKEIDEKYNMLEKMHYADEVNEILHFLHSLLDKYENVLPRDVANNIDSIFKSTDPSQMKNMLMNVRNSVQQSMNAMPAMGNTVSSSLIIKGIIVAAAIGGASYGISVIVFPVEIQIFNQGCQPIVPLQNVPSIPGLKLPSTPILSGGEATATVPRVSVTIAASTSGSLSIGVLGQNIPISFHGRVTDIQFDDMSIIGQSKSINLGEKQQHKLVVICK